MISLEIEVRLRYQPDGETLAKNSEPQLGLHGTFLPNKSIPVHRWYPYLEGFSSYFVENTIENWAPQNFQTLYDPFGGTGTVVSVGTELGIDSYYSEINPFMRDVIEAKTNVLYRVAKNVEQTKNYFLAIIDAAKRSGVTEEIASEILSSVFPGRPYFLGKRLTEIVSLKIAIDSLAFPDDDSRLLARVALASIGVPSSEMKRQTDLRYRNEREPQDPNLSPIELFADKSDQIIQDATLHTSQNIACTLASESAITRNEISGTIDLVLTSPPYLNGTNYFRNTKIELWLTGHISHEKELIELNQKAMIAGINNVSKYSRKGVSLDLANEIANRLEPVTYDKRIPTLIRGYATDTDLWVNNCEQMMRKGGRLVIDIGDSKFAGIHVPTDRFIKLIAESNGLSLINSQIVRERRSKDGSPLKQFLLVFEK